MTFEVSGIDCRRAIGTGKLTGLEEDSAMQLLGTIVNGHVHLDAPAGLPEGSRVTVLPGVDVDDFGPPTPQETYAEHLALLRESIAESEAGVPGYTVDEAFAILHAGLRRPVGTTEG